MKRTVLVVDDEKNIRDTLEGVLGDEGYGVLLAENSEEALSLIKTSHVDLVLLDIWMPGIDGIETLKTMKKMYESIPVVMISGHATVETAVKATKLGAYDFLEKPLSLEKVVLTLEHAIEQKSLMEENAAFIQGEQEKYEIIGESKPMEVLRQGIQRAAPTNSWVLITGENGTGKELVARNIHLYSKRARKPFVAVNCAAIPEELIESELFGHEKGAFTSAVAQRKGRFDMANNGTLFLDEIGDMSLKTQAKVLRVLQEQSFERVGGTAKITVDVRVVAATNKDLTEEIRKGNFREDLYYRVNVIPFHVLPLRERPSDITLYIDYYLREFSRVTSNPVHEIDDEAKRILLSYRWPGNVRELKNLIERLVIMSPTGVVTPEELPLSIRGAEGVHSTSLFNGTLKEARQGFEKEFITRKLRECAGNISKTAETIGVERSHLHRKIKGYGIRK